ncbi:MAG TPA: hypothetical protein PK711_05260 [Bacteroidales bacterium]|nr:hypothetical protein [Bacteroidales bacterium]
MYDENLHIIPDPDKGYPKPEIPADEAWNKMSELLNQEMPASTSGGPAPPGPSPSSEGGLFGGGSHFWIIALGVVGVSSLVTWGVLHHVIKPEKSDNKYQMTTALRDSSMTESIISSLKDQKTPASPEHISSSETKDYLDEQQNSQKSRTIVVNNSPRTIVPRVEDKTVSEQDFSLTSSALAPLVAGDSATQVSAQYAPSTISDSLATISGQLPGNKHHSPDTLANTYHEPELLLPVPDTTESHGEPLSGEDIPINPSAGVRSVDTTKPAGPSSRTLRLSENHRWQTGLYSHIGSVFQKGRNANLYYGGMLTAGLWNRKWKAGVETGLGWESCQDYGSVLETIRLEDSLTVDTVGNIKTIDTTRILNYNYQYQYLQIPLFISKQLFTKGKFSIDVKTGPVVGIMISDKKSLDQTTGPDNGEILSTADNDYSRQKISWQWQVLPQFRWNINDRLSLTLSPSGTFYLNSLYDPKNRPDGIPYGISVYGALIYKFN